MDVVYEAIGGNVGFLPSNVNTLTAITSDVRDLGKSVLRGVPNFITYPDQHKTDSQWQPGFWYPPPSTHTDGTNYNVFNLDPFVWFVHQKVGLSGYGFSFDDDVSDVGAGGASALPITYASGPSANPVQSQWFPSTPWGAVTVMATISAPEQSGPYQGKSILTIEPQDTKGFLAGQRGRPDEWSGWSVRLDHGRGRSVFRRGQISSSALIRTHCSSYSVRV